MANFVPCDRNLQGPIVFILILFYFIGNAHISPACSEKQRGASSISPQDAEMEVQHILQQFVQPYPCRGVAIRRQEKAANRS